ncbi:MAG: hypothetical protein KAG20_07315 [Cocleimonas sp.]|nr:hypothetical protein [Cocleimonas sp.]
MHSQKGFSIAMVFALLLAVSVIITIAGAYYFIDKTRNNPFDGNMVTLHALQQLDAKWSKNILKTHRYTLQDFDQLAQNMSNISEALKTLEQHGMSNAKIVNKATLKKYQIYKYSFATKNTAVENYKSQHAILRNSVRYLPEVGKIAHQALASNDSPNTRSVAKLLNTSTLLINHYLLNIEPHENVKKQLTQLESTAQTINATSEKKLRDYLLHAALILKHKPKVDNALQTVLSVDIATLSNELVSQYVSAQDIVKRHITQLQQVILMGVIILLALLAWFLFRLRKSATILSLTSTEKKSIQTQLLHSEEQVEVVNRKMKRLIEQSTSEQLSLNTFKLLKTSMPALATHISFLKNLKKNQALAVYKNKMNLLIADIDTMYHHLYQLNNLIDPQKNKEQQVSFDFNYVIQSAFDTVSSNNKSVNFNKQLSSVPVIKASSTDLYLITTKLLQQSAMRWQEDDESIFVKTWATGHYANLCLSISGYETIEALYAEKKLSDITRLLEQNAAILKLTSREEGKSAIIWVSFPYGR